MGKLGAIEKSIIIKTTELKDILNVSQQTISRWLEELKEQDYILKEQTKSGLKIQISDRGNKEILLPAFSDLQKMYYRIPTQIRGILTKGLGEGGYYISMAGYTHQFKRILGWKPFSGTLNLNLRTEEDIEAFQRLLRSPYHLIDGFRDESTNRSFGKVFIWPCTITYEDQSVEGSIIYPDRTHHSPRQIIELIAPKNLRMAMNLHDEDTIVVKPHK